MIQAKNGTYYQDTTNCDGSNPTIVANKYCDIPMEDFTSTAYNLI